MEQDPLANLRDIHLPGDVSWWPLAPGWWLLIALVVVLLIWAGVMWYKKRQRLVLIKEISAELEHIQQTYQHHQNNKTLLADYSQLLRRLVILHAGRNQAANLSGVNWLSKLKAYSPTQEIADEVLNLLVDGKYQREIKLDDPQGLIEWVNDCAIAIGQHIVQEKSHA